MTDPNKAPTEIEALVEEARARAIYLVDTYCPAAASDTWEDVLMIRRLADRLEQLSSENALYIASVERLTKAQGRAWDAGAAIGRDLARQEQSASEFGVSEQTSGSADGFTLDRHSAEGAAAGDRPLTRPSWDECGHPTWHATNSDELGGNRLNLACDKCGAPGEVYWPAT